MDVQILSNFRVVFPTLTHGYMWDVSEESLDFYLSLVKKEITRMVEVFKTTDRVRCTTVGFDKLYTTPFRPHSGVFSNSEFEKLVSTLIVLFRLKMGKVSPSEYVAFCMAVGEASDSSTYSYTDEHTKCYVFINALLKRSCGNTAPADWGNFFLSSHKGANEFISFVKDYVKGVNS